MSRFLLSSLGQVFKRPSSVGHKSLSMSAQQFLRYGLGFVPTLDLARKKKLVKDKNAPKGAMSPYTFFGSDIRSAMKEKNPDLDALAKKELTKDIGVRWKAMSDKDKVPFEEKAKVDESRYIVEMAAYKQSILNAPKQKTTKKVKDKDAPKGTMSAYLIFSNDTRSAIKEANPALLPTDIVRELGVRWKAMSAKGKVPYEKKAEVDKKRYQNEMDAFVKKRTAAGEETNCFTNVAVKKKKVKRVKDVDAPKRNLSSFMLFGVDTRSAIKEANPALLPTDIVKELGVRWRALSDEAKAPFVAQAAEDKARYMQEMAAYKEQ